MDRRGFTVGLGASALGAAVSLPGCVVRPAPRDWAGELATIERGAGGRLGAYVLDPGSGAGFGWRSGERFGMCSTFKLSLAALVLREIAAGRLRADEVLRYNVADLLPTSPVTTANLAQGGMTVLALAEATQVTSDNLAANLLLKRLGGPAALTAFWRKLGDPSSRLDRYEPALNFVPPGELRDTATPEGVAGAVARMLTPQVMGDRVNRDRLVGWMEATRTGLKRIRAGLPADWRGGDKTGTAIAEGMANKVNDIAVLFPPGGRSPLVVVGFYEADGFRDTIRPQDEAVLAEVGRLAVAWAQARWR